MKRIVQGSILALTLSSYAYYVIQQRNHLLGTQLLGSYCNQQARLSSHDVQTEEYNQMERWLQKTSLNCEIYSKYLSTYAYRLLYYHDYLQLCTLLNNQLVTPIIQHYQNQGLLDIPQLIIQMTNTKQFNNKLNQKITQIQSQNTALREQNAIFLQTFQQLQNKLMTVHIVHLSDDYKKQIDLLYRYLVERQRLYVKLSGRSPDEQRDKILQGDYYAKVQLL